MCLMLFVGRAQCRFGGYDDGGSRYFGRRRHDDESSTLTAERCRFDDQSTGSVNKRFTVQFNA